MIPNSLLEKYPLDLDKWAILLAYRGSVAHGMYIPNSDPNSIDDIDLMGICVPPIEYYFGLREFGTRGTKEIKFEEYDIVIYEAKKFISLLSQGNPNVLSMLWLEDSMFLRQSQAGKYLLQNRVVFVGKHVYNSFIGYAYGQLHRMTHYKFEGYMGEKRKSLVDRYGYDCKNAAHLIRLLRMAIEFLRDGHLYVKRIDAEELLEIKRGRWTLDQVVKESERLFKIAEVEYQKSMLPETINMGLVNEVSTYVIKLALKER
jgi:predicted nucleotidyltransferase